MLQIFQQYFRSPDFNGLPLVGETLDDVKTESKKLVHDGLVQVVGDEDYLNPHIRPWQSRRSLKSQMKSIDMLKPKKPSVVLYPTPKALKSYKGKKRYPGMPYRQEMARGKGTLELAYFRFDVLQQYRDDPRFDFHYGDFGASMGIGDEAYDDGSTPEGDKTHSLHMGFAYDTSNLDPENPDSPIVRLVASWYGDLADLSATHQQRWKTYEVSGENLQPHPAWFMGQMGQFPDALGPFEKMFYELDNINQLWANTFGLRLFKTAERPNDFGWILRASQHEWDTFVHESDKLLSDNIDHKALNAAKVPRKGDDGKEAGTLFRLEAFFKQTNMDEDKIKEIMKPLRDIRLARQKPAHELRKNLTDKTFVHKQIALIGEVNKSLHLIRLWLTIHPVNKDWKPYFNDEKSYKM